MINASYTLAFLPFIFWGLWAFFSKISTTHIQPKSAFLYEIIGLTVVALVSFIATGFTIEHNAKGVTFGLLAGVANALGILLFLFALQRFNTALIITITALYPVVTIILSYFFLNETINLKQGLGVVLALVAITLLAS